MTRGIEESAIDGSGGGGGGAFPTMTPYQAKAVAIAPKLPALLSILGSSCICLAILRSPQRRSRVNQRLLLGMSLCDVASSVAHFLSTWPMPRDSPGVWGAAGTVGTCSAQGFFAHCSVCVACYNACLSLYYYLVVVRSDHSEAVMRRTTERAMHVVSVGWPAIGGLIATSDGAMNPGGGSACWIRSDPPGCRGSPEVECVRGERADIYVYVFAIPAIMVCLVSATVAWILLCSVVLQEGKTVKTRLEERTAASLRRLVTRQATLYLGAFYLTWLVSLASVTGNGENFPLDLAQSIVLPLQGAFNVIVYFHPVGFSCFCTGARCRLGRTERANASPSDEANSSAFGGEHGGGSAVEEPRDCQHPAHQQQQGAEDCIDELSDALEMHWMSQGRSPPADSTDETPSGEMLPPSASGPVRELGDSFCDEIDLCGDGRA